MVRVFGRASRRTIALFVGVQAVAVAAAPQLAADGVRYGDGGTALVPLVAGLALGTLLGVAVARGRLPPRVFRWLAVGSVGVSVWFALAPIAGRAVGRVAAGVIGAVGAVGAVWAVSRTDSRAVRNAVTALGAGGAAAVFGASLTPSFAAVAVIAATGYDALAVYGVGHMQRLAAVGRWLELPTVFVVRESSDCERAVDDSADRDKVRERSVSTDAPVAGDRLPDEPTPRRRLLGAGDAVFPAMLTASLATHLLTTWLLAAPIAGGVAGLLLLQRVVARGETHAGLPFVVGGTLCGWLPLVV